MIRLLEKQPLVEGSAFSRQIINLNLNHTFSEDLVVELSVPSMVPLYFKLSKIDWQIIRNENFRKTRI